MLLCCYCVLCQRDRAKAPFLHHHPRVTTRESSQASSWTRGNIKESSVEDREIDRWTRRSTRAGDPTESTTISQKTLKTKWNKRRIQFSLLNFFLITDTNTTTTTEDRLGRWLGWWRELPQIPIRLRLLTVKWRHRMNRRRRYDDDVVLVKVRRTKRE